MPPRARRNNDEPDNMEPINESVDDRGNETDISSRDYGQRQNAEPNRSQHYMEREVDLFKYNTGLQLIPEFSGKHWDDFNEK